MTLVELNRRLEQLVDRGSIKGTGEIREGGVISKVSTPVSLKTDGRCIQATFGLHMGKNEVRHGYFKSCSVASEASVRPWAVV